jgi:aminoglycoside phosphotransferase (APT) family kinase protein
MKATCSSALPGFDEATLRGHLLAVADTIADVANASGLAEAGDSVRRLRECATVSARIAQALGERAARVDTGLEAELDALTGSEAAFNAAHPLQHSASNASTDSDAGARRLDAKALERYIQQHPLGGSEVRLKTVRILSGGRCKLTALVEHAGSGALPDRLILRQDWNGGATETTVADEFRMLDFLHAEGLLVPRPYLLEAAPGEAGLPFMLMQHMPGALQAGLFEPPADAGLAVQLAEQLGRLHAIDPARARELGLADPAIDLTATQSTLKGFAQAHQNIGIASSIITAALDWLADNLHLFGAERCLVHNDLGFHNCLTQDGRLTAVLDWELAQIGHPAADLGYVKHFVQRMMPWDLFLAQYRSAGGWNGDSRCLRFHTIWNAVRLYGLIMRARAATAAGLVRDIEISHACADNVVLLLIFLGEELQAAQD